MHGDIDLTGHGVRGVSHWILNRVLLHALMMTVECVRMLVGSMVNASTHWLPLLSGCHMYPHVLQLLRHPIRVLAGQLACDLAALRGGVVALLLHALAHDAEARADDQQVLPDSGLAGNLVDELSFALRTRAACSGCGTAMLPSLC
jgi:hypothetical protein